MRRRIDGSVVVLIAIVIVFSCLVFAQQNVCGAGVSEGMAGDTTPSTAGSDVPSYAERVVHRIDSLCTGEVFITSQLGLVVYDLDADRVVYMVGERQLLRPASTMKLLTAITAIEQLGSDYTFRTTLYADGKYEDNTFVGNLYVQGTMDPTLDSTVLDSLAAAVCNMYIDTLRGNILADRSFMDSPKYGEGWSWDDENPVLSPLVYDCSDALIPLLHRRLIAQGIIIIGNDGVGTTPDTAITIAEHRTQLSIVLPIMLKQSNNQYAESVFYNIGAQQELPSTAAKAKLQQQFTLRQAGLNPNDYNLADGSGLSPYNFLTAESLVFLLRYAYRDKRIYNALYNSLPIAGIDGTLKWRMKKGAARDNVHAKTGTLTGVSSLAGYCTSPEGHTIAFAIINQGMLKRQTAHAFQDAVCNALCE